MQDYQTEFELRGAHIIDQFALAGLCRCASDFVNSRVEVEIDFDGKERVRSNDPNLILSGKLAQTRDVLSVQILGSNWENGVHRQMRLSLVPEPNYLKPAIRFAAAGDREQCFIFRLAIEEMLKKRETWYAFLYRASASRLLIAGLALCAFDVFLVVGYVLSQYAGLAGASLVLNTISFSLWVFLGLYFARTKLFPKLAFDFGHSSLMVRRTERLRFASLSALALVSLIGLTGIMLAGYLTYPVAN